jgi:TIR domain-containing protein/tetratricopeptide repeat protein
MDSPSHRDAWLDLAPGPPQLLPGQKWHVYISYRSVNRPWVLQLYDVLKDLGYQVFLDQYVLTTSGSLIPAMEEGLEQSAAAVLVWSAASQDSDWIRREYQAFEEREAGKNFRFVVVTLDRARLPVFLASRLYVDFSESREGPSGTGLLQLLYGLRGEPLPAKAIKLAAQVDAEIRDNVALIQSARSVGNPERLVRLADSDTLAWQSSPVLLCQVASALIALGEYDRALSVIDQCRRRFPKAVRPQQLQGLALARKGDWESAQLILGTLYNEGERDPETVSLLARTWRDRYRLSNDRAFLVTSRDLYAEAFRAAPDEYYAGINAASNSALLGDLETAAKYARQVEAIVGTSPSDDYWRTVTAAEAKLLQQDYSWAAELYRAAAAQHPADAFGQESVYRQAQLLLGSLKAPDRMRELVLEPFAGLRAAQSESTVRSVPLEAAELAMVANLLYRMVARRHASSEILTSIEPAKFWEAVRKLRPNARREDLQSLAAEIGGTDGGDPNPLWLAWMQTVRSRDLERLFE